MNEENIEEAIENTVSDNNADIDADSVDLSDENNETTGSLEQNDTLDAILRLLEEEHDSRITESGANVSTDSVSDNYADILDYLDQIECDLDTIRHNTEYLTVSGNNIDTPLNEYELTNILLVVVIIMFFATIVGSFIKNYVFHIR